MKFTADRKQVLQAVQTISRAIATKSARPILSGILIEARENKVIVTAYDLELGIKQSLTNDLENHIQIEQEGSIVIPGKPFIDIVRRLSGDTLTMMRTPDKRIFVQSEELKCHFHLMNAEEFPVMPVVNVQQSVSIPSNVLRTMIKSTVFAASTMESRPILTGVYIEYTRDGILGFVATDSLRLARRTTRLPEMDAVSFKANIPGSSMMDLLQILPDTEIDVSMHLMDSHCMFRVGTVEFYTRIIDGTYIEVSRLIPSSHKANIVVSTSQIIQSLERASVFASHNQEILLSVSNGIAIVTTQSSDIGELRDSIPTHSENRDDVQITFKVKNVLEALRTCDSERVVFGINAPLQPFTLSPDGQTDLIHVISPVITRIQ